MNNFEQSLGYLQLTDESYRKSDAKSAEANGARLSESVPPSTETMRQLNLGEYAKQKVLLASEGFEGADIGSVTAIGGFCAIPTYEMLNIQSGYVTNPGSGERIDLPNTGISEAAQMVTVVRVDKVLEAVGISRNPTAVVSESQMWGDRLYTALAEQGARRNVQIDAVQTIVAESDNRAFAYLRNAFKLLNPDGEGLTIFIDVDIMEDLIRIRDELFARYALELDPDDSYSLIYASMYSGPYKEVLERDGYIPRAQITAIYEPMNHATLEQGSKALFNSKMLRRGSPDQYLREGGINEEMGFIAFANMMDSNGRIFRRFLPTPLLPNELNFKNFRFDTFPITPKVKGLASIEEFTYVEDTSNLNLNANPIFLWAANLLPTNNSLTLMTEMVSISERYKAGKNEIKVKYRNDRESIQSAIQGLRDECQLEMARISEQLEIELKRQINLLFQLP